MVESLKELSAKCQKPQYKKVGNWMVRHILRDAALPMTWLLLHTSVTANQVTLFSIFVGIAASVCFAVPSSGFFLTGALLLQFWYYLDHVDGQIARYRGTACLSGRFFDFVTHHLIHAIIIFPLGVYAYQKSGAFIFVLLGFIGSLGSVMFNLIYDVQYKTFFEKIVSLKTLEIKGAGQSAGENNPLPVSVKKRIFEIGHKSHEIHVMMNILTLGALLEVFIRFIDFRFILFIYFAAAAPFLAAVKTAHFIKTKKIDQSFDETFTVQN